MTEAPQWKKTEEYILDGPYGFSEVRYVNEKGTSLWFPSSLLAQIQKEAIDEFCKIMGTPTADIVEAAAYVEDGNICLLEQFRPKLWIPVLENNVQKAGRK